MRIAIAADHAAVSEKAALAEELRRAGHEVADHGTQGDESVDYPDHALPVARAVGSGEAERGLLLCGTGTGPCMVANKVPGVRAAVLFSPENAELARRHNDANVACLGARLLTLPAIRELVRIFLETPFDGGRHARRVAKIDALDAPRR